MHRVRSLAWIVSLLWAVSLAPRIVVGAEPLPSAATQLVNDLLTQAAGLRGKSVAIGEISSPEGRPAEFADLYAAALEDSLMLPAKIRDLKVLDRRNVEALAKEWALDANGLVDDASAKQAGRLIGVDVLLLGKYLHPEEKKLELRATLVETETGRILAAATAQIKADKRLRAACAQERPAAAAAAPAAGALKVELWTDKKEYAVGDKLQVKVRASQDCHLTLIDVGTSGGVSIIFPNHQAADNAVKAGVTYTIPGPEAGFDFEVGGPSGRELLRAIASREPVVDLADAVSRTSAQKPFAEPSQDPAILTRDIHVQGKKAKPGEWSEASLALKIR